jgi:dinuclear metal center YbgI/SA1388 family protein
LHSFLLAERMTPRVSDILGIINKIAPSALAEGWDNVGLQVGNPSSLSSRIMVALDAGKEAIEAAITAQCQLLLTHHPFLFHSIKKINIADPLGNLIVQAIKNDLAIISLHTNFDIADGGVNDLLVESLGITSSAPLKITSREELRKLSVFVPKGYEEKVLEALFRFSGFIGNYSDCSFKTYGIGTFKPHAGAKPFIGEQGKRENVEEARIEVLLRNNDVSAALNALFKVHPYEEPAFDLYPLMNEGKACGLGRIGALEWEVPLDTFAGTIKEKFALQGLRFVGEGRRKVRKIAVCGGSGASLLHDAKRQGADVFVTGDIKYHDARDAQMMDLALIDLGHFASEALMIHGLKARIRMELADKGYEAEILACEAENDPFNFL